MSNEDDLERATLLSQKWAVGVVDPAAINRLPEPVVVAINLALGTAYSPQLRYRIFSQLKKLHDNHEIIWKSEWADIIFDSSLQRKILDEQR